MSQFAHGIRYFDASSMSTDNVQLTPMATYVLGVHHSSAESLVQHLQSIIWLTYRRDFAQMVPYEFTSDAGWGCMLRTAQMMLCEALLRNLSIHRTTRFCWKDNETLAPEVVQVLRSFVDSPKEEDGCFYAIHRMVQVGMKYDMLPGEWYGPTTAAQVLRDLVNAQIDSNLCMYVPQDGVIYTDEINKLCVTKWVHEQPSTSNASVLYDPLLNPPKIDTSAPWNKSIFILIPLRLGLDQLNTTYIPALTQVFEFPQSLGIIGGKRGHSVYFVGARGHQFHILDPHTVHPTTEVDGSFPTATHARTIHSTDHLVMEVDYIDPSLAVGFYCRNRQDYNDLCTRLSVMAASTTCPITKRRYMPRITLDLLRKRSEHNEGIISTLEEISLHQEELEKIELIGTLCRKLRILYLQNNIIEKIEDLTHMKELRYLNLALNNIKRIEGLSNCEFLEKLDLTVNFIDVDALEDSIDHLKPFEHLKELYMLGNPAQSDWDGFTQYLKFHMNDEEKPGFITLEVFVPKYLDSSLINVDMHPTYVTITIKNKLLRLRFQEEVKCDQGTALRSKTTGALKLTVEKVDPKSIARALRAKASRQEQDNNKQTISELSKKPSLQTQVLGCAVQINRIVHRPEDRERQATHKVEAYSTRRLAQENSCEPPLLY
ncbi:cysteine protease family C54 [Thraustotheca clavata]|uniref:Cysteine protease n=1 Tax=Thraustotheca clavata TaxID=74557 RepID=A0A1V9ZSS6_9STRA|nr:cysteine protease family C54 [Thraustotheca clavata]